MASSKGVGKHHDPSLVFRLVTAGSRTEPQVLEPVVSKALEFVAVTQAGPCPKQPSDEFKIASECHRIGHPENVTAVPLTGCERDGLEPLVPESPLQELWMEPSPDELQYGTVSC